MVTPQTQCLPYPRILLVDDQIVATDYSRLKKVFPRILLVLEEEPLSCNEIAVAILGKFLKTYDPSCLEARLASLVSHRYISRTGDKYSMEDRGKSMLAEIRAFAAAGNRRCEELLAPSKSPG